MTIDAGVVRSCDEATALLERARQRLAEVDHAGAALTDAVRWESREARRYGEAIERWRQQVRAEAEQLAGSVQSIAAYRMNASAGWGIG